MIGAAVGESGGVTCLAEGGVGESGRSSRLWSSFLLEGGGDSGGEDLSATGGGGASVGATSSLISGGESGGAVRFSGPNPSSAEEILGFGARGGLDLG